MAYTGCATAGEQRLSLQRKVQSAEHREKVQRFNAQAKQWRKFWRKSKPRVAPVPSIFRQAVHLFSISAGPLSIALATSLNRLQYGACDLHAKRRRTLADWHHVDLLLTHKATLVCVLCLPLWQSEPGAMVSRTVQMHIQKPDFEAYMCWSLRFVCLACSCGMGEAAGSEGQGTSIPSQDQAQTAGAPQLLPYSYL